MQHGRLNGGGPAACVALKCSNANTTILISVGLYTLIKRHMKMYNVVHFQVCFTRCHLILYLLLLPVPNAESSGKIRMRVFSLRELKGETI